VIVNTKQNDHIKTVLHTSTNDLETGLISFDIATATGTEIAIDKINAIMRMSKVVFLEICSKNIGTFSK
jgi:hypothetical protein